MEPFLAPDRFEADGFVLRSYRPGDGPAMRAAVVASYDHLKPWMPWATPDQSDAEAELLVRQFRARWLTAEDFTMGIFDLDEREVLGGCGFHLREGPLSTRCAEMGMWIGAPHAGRGLGTRAIEALLAWGFTEWPWLRLSWRCDDLNAASVRAAEKAGLEREGVLRGQQAEVGEGRRDTLCFALLREEWLRRSPQRHTP